MFAFIFILMALSTGLKIRAQEPESSIITYSVGQYETLHSSLLGEDRQLLIHLPEDYENTKKQYMVLYIFDGENTHRYIQSVMAVTFYSSIRRLPQMICVGILNTDRTRDMTPRKVKQRPNSGGGDTFLKFIISELIPHIEKQYRSAPYRMLFGGSSAGMFALYTLFSRLGSFNAYIASRPALNSYSEYTWDSDVIFQSARSFFKESHSGKISLFIDYGGQEDRLHNPEPIHQLAEIFQKKPSKRFRWEIQETGESRYRSAESLKNGLLSVFKAWHYSADSLYTDGFLGIERYAQALSERFDYPVTVADLLKERDLIMFGHRFLENEQVRDAVSFFKYAVSAYPSWYMYDILAKAYMIDGKNQLAIQCYEKSLALNPENTNAVNMLKQLK